MSSAMLLQSFLMYVIVPVWLFAGIADWACHRTSQIELTSGPKESLLHFIKLGTVGLPLMAVLFMEVNAAILLVMAVGVVLHQAAAVVDVRYANATGRVSPVEQHLHGVLEMSPAIAAAVVAMLQWPDLVNLLNGQGDFTLAWKRNPLPRWYLMTAIVGVLCAGVLPYTEELVRTLRNVHYRLSLERSVEWRLG